MNELSLSRLYRRLTSAPAQSDMDAADLADVVTGDVDSADVADARHDAIVARLATSAPHAALARMLVALKPSSASLAETMNRHRRNNAHPVRVREMRPAAGALRGRVHRLRWVGAIAACACAAVVLGMWSHQHEQTQDEGIATRSAVAPASDRIFTSRDEIFASSDAAMHHRRAHARADDELFHGSFSAGG